MEKKKFAKKFILTISMIFLGQCGYGLFALFLNFM
jgi:hypothetical protein